MQTYKKKSLQIVVEQTMVQPLIGVIDRAGAPGYTVVPVIAGRGHQGAWQSGEVSGTSSMAMVIVILDETLAGRLLDEAYALLKDYIAVFYLSDVEVMRSEHF